MELGSNLPKDILIEILARVGPGSTAIQCLFVCHRWRALLLQPSFYLQVCRVGKKPLNNWIFGKDSGLDPNHPTGMQATLSEFENRALCVQWRTRIKHSSSSKELNRTLHERNRTPFERQVALNLYLRFDHPPLWIICGNIELEESEQKEMVRSLLYCGAEVDLCGGSGVRSTPLQGLKIKCGEIKLLKKVS